jgi:hypothetical protein
MFIKSIRIILAAAGNNGLVFILCGTETNKNIASWYKSYGIVSFVLIPTYKMHPAGAIFEFW